MPQWLKQKLHLPREIRKQLPGKWDKSIVFTTHHESHAASAFFPSPFEEAAILTMDGVGEWDTATIGVGTGNHIELLKSMHFPDSLGLLYSAFTYFCGFKVNSGEYKLMGLAPYGNPSYTQVIRDHLIQIHEDGSFHLNMDYFGFLHSDQMSHPKLHNLLGGPPRQPDSPMEQRFMDLARSIQEVSEEVIIKLARHTREVTQLPNLCLAGGVALNCVANGKILAEGSLSISILHTHIHNAVELEVIVSVKDRSFASPVLSSNGFIPIDPIRRRTVTAIPSTRSAPPGSAVCSSL